MKKKIMLIVPMLHQGGFERVCVATARLLEPHFDVCIVMFDSRDIAYDIKGLDVTDLHMGVRPGKLAKVFNVIKRSMAVRKLKKERGIDIAYSFGPSANMVNVFSKTEAKIWVGIRSYMDMDNHFLLRLFAGRADKILCCTKRIEEEIGERYRCSKAVTLYNPLDGEALKKSAEEAIRLPWDEKENIIVSMGREDDVKGFWHLIKSFSLVRADIPDAKLMIIGDGEFEEYKVLAKQLGIGDDVYFTGLKKNPFPYLKAAKLYVLTSYREGFPNALIEAMSFGIPVIAADCPTGPDEILRKGDSLYGVLIPNMSPEKNLDAAAISEEEKGLADEMKKMITDRAYYEKYGKASARRAQDFNNESYAERLMGWIVDCADE